MRTKSFLSAILCAMASAAMAQSFTVYENGKSHELIRFYVTDDDNHIPMRLDMFLSFGSAKAFLKSYKGVRGPMTSKVQ